MADLFGLGSVIGSGIDLAGSLLTQKMQAAEAKKSREFSREMSNTSYRRAVADLRAAGLNPMLAYTQGGANTPSSATAQVATGLETLGSRSVNSAVALQEKKQAIELLDTQTKKTAAEATEAVSRTDLNFRLEEKAKQEIIESHSRVMNNNANTAVSAIHLERQKNALELQSALLKGELERAKVGERLPSLKHLEGIIDILNPWKQSNTSDVVR